MTAPRISAVDVRKKYESDHPGTIMHAFKKQEKRRSTGGKDKASIESKGSRSSKKSKRIHRLSPSAELPEKEAGGEMEETTSEALRNILGED